MEQLINEIYELIKDFRSDEGIASVRMTPERIRTWINQFEEADRAFILSELKNIFDKRYCTKKEAIDFLKGSLKVLCEKYKYGSINDFLLDSVLLDLQKPNKSQPQLLKLLKQILHDEFSFEIANCGSKVKKNFIYLDDVLCTGNTLFQNIKTWILQKDSNGKTYLENLKSGNSRLIFLYIFIHNANYQKKIAQFRYQIDKDLEQCYTMFRLLEIENGLGSKLEVLFPTDEIHPEIVATYQTKIDEQVQKYCEEKKIPNPPGLFHRPSDQPANETFFTSLANRKRFEDIIFHKGIRILNAANTNIPNLRALGYSLPSLKNFGFGTLCFTWRNVPNNCPIVFWYSGGGFFPLFVKHQTN